MSHFTRIQTRLRDLDVIATSLTDLGYPFDSEPARGFRGLRTESVLRVPRPGGYDIAFQEGTDGFDVVADFEMLPGFDYQGFVRQLTRRYAYHVTCRQLEAQGFSVVEEQTAHDGRVHLVLRRMAMA